MTQITFLDDDSREQTIASLNAVNNDKYTANEIHCAADIANMARQHQQRAITGDAEMRSITNPGLVRPVEAEVASPTDTQK